MKALFSNATVFWTEAEIKREAGNELIDRQDAVLKSARLDILDGLQEIVNHSLDEEVEMKTLATWIAVFIARHKARAALENRDV